MSLVSRSDVIRCHTDTPVRGAIVDIHYRIQYVYKGQCVVMSEIASQLEFQVSIETFHNGSLDVVIFGCKEFDPFLTQPLLEFPIGKFGSLVRL